MEGSIQLVRSALTEILPFRNLYLRDMNCQVRYHAVHERGWSDSYLVTMEDVPIGYASVKGKDNLKDRDTIFEFYLAPPYRPASQQVFSQLTRLPGLHYIECQSNDPFLTPWLFQFGEGIVSDTILFGEHRISNRRLDDVTFRPRLETDPIFLHQQEPIGDYVLVHENVIVATGGFLLHYNPPFADLYMEVMPEYRRRGFGSYLLQELIRKCYNSGRIPAARCHVNNIASKASLMRAGLQVVGYMLIANIRNGL